MDEIYFDKASCLADGFRYKQNTIANTKPIFQRIRYRSSKVVTASDSNTIER